MKNNPILVVIAAIVLAGGIYFFTRPKEKTSTGPKVAGGLKNTGTAAAPDMFGWGVQKYLPQFKAGSTGADFSTLAATGVNAITRIASQLIAQKKPGVPAGNSDQQVYGDHVPSTPSFSDIGSGIPYTPPEPVTSIDLDTGSGDIGPGLQVATNETVTSYNIE